MSFEQSLNAQTLFLNEKVAIIQLKVIAKNKQHFKSALELFNLVCLFILIGLQKKKHTHTRIGMNETRKKNLLKVDP